MASQAEKTLFHPLVSLEWKRCALLPKVQRMRDAQAVVLNNKVYVSPAEILDPTGMMGFESNKICIYDVSGNSWKEIHSTTSQHALAVYNKQVVLIGGNDHSTHICTNELRVLQNDEEKRTQLLPPMPTKRSNASAIGIGSHLAVAGGHEPARHYPIPLKTVEIYDGQQWKAAEFLPKPSYYMKSVLQGDTWYLMGGEKQDREVYCVSLNDLIATTNPQITSPVTPVWKNLPAVPFKNSTPAVFMNELITIGGKESVDLPPQFSALQPLQALQPPRFTSKIHAYSTSTQSWVHVGDMPDAYCSTCATTLPSGELFLVGTVNYPYRISTAHVRCDQVLKGSAKGSQSSMFTVIGTHQDSVKGETSTTGFGATGGRRMQLKRSEQEFEVPGRKRKQLEGSDQGMLKKMHLGEAPEDEQHYKAYQQALKEGVAIPLKYVKVLFFGPPQTGKTSLRRRLVGEIMNLAKEPFQTSTGTAEGYDVIIKLVEDKISDKISTSTTVITKSKWSNVKSLFGKETNIHETELDEELRLLYQFIYGVVLKTEKSSPVPDMVITGTAQEEAIREPSPAVQPNVVDSNVNTEMDIPTVSSFQNVSSDVKEGYGLSAKETEEIEKAFEAFDKVLHTGGEEQLKFLLEETILVNMVDTGGQPAFLEMLPALTISPALYLIFFRLNQELNKRYQVQYVSDNEEIQLGESLYTVEEVIFQALSSIACFSCAAPKKANMPKPSHAAMLIGTHKDLLGSEPETVATKIKVKDDALRKSLVKILETDLLKSHKNLLRYASEDQLMFAIDNMTGDEGELENVRKRLEDIIKQEFDDWPIPASWLMFSIFLRKMGKRTMSLLQCYKIGDRLNVKNTDEALWFLHHRVGILMHFPEVEEIKDIVICDPQVVFDSVTELILNSFTFEKVSKQACDKFQETGQFSFKDIQRIAKSLKTDSLPLPKLFKLLEYLNIIAPIKPGDSLPSSSLPLGPELNQKENVVYFMPAILRHANEEELHMKQSCTDPAPLVIRFKCGFVPIGVFCATIASLVAQKDGWILQEPSKYHSQDNHILSKNKATFRFNAAYDVTLISKAKRYEIHITCILTTVTDKATLIEVCSHVLETVCDVLDQVISKMKFKQYVISSPFDQNVYELGFKCPEHPDSDHLAINRPKKGESELLSLSAKCVWLNYHEGKSIMVCLEEEKEIVFTEPSLLPSFAQQSLVWCRKVTRISSPSPDPIFDSSPQSPELKDLMHLQVSDWYRLGLALTLPSYDLDIIEKDFRGDTRKQTCKMFDCWLKTQPDASYEQLIKALHDVGDETLATSLYGILDERLDQIRRKRLRVEFDGDVDSPDVKRIRKSIEDATGRDHRFMIPLQHSEGGDYPISNIFRDMPDPAVPDKVEMKDQNIQTETVEFKHQYVQAGTRAQEQDKMEVKHQNIQTKTVEIKDQQVQTETRTQEQAHIRGVEVIAKETFTLTQEAVKLNFEGYGFKLCVPENSLPAEVSETQLSVQVSLSGPFQMPSNCELVSAVYWVSSPHKFRKPVTVEIQHCAVLSNDKQCSQLTFVHTKCTQKELPYIFKQRVGGVFTPHSSYGSLSLSHFSGIGVVIKPPLQRSFKVQPLPVQAIYVQPVLPASSRAIDTELGQHQQEQQQRSSELSEQAFSSEQLQQQERQQQTCESSGQAIDSQQQKQTSGSEQLQQQQLLQSSGQAIDSELVLKPQHQSSSQSEAACQTGQEEEGTEVFEQYRAQLYITCKLVTEWKVDFVVTKDLDSCSTIVKKEYFSHGQPQFSFTFCFKEEFVCLKIPEKGKLGGWIITPFYDPKITRQQVNCFSFGKNIPKCELLLEWDQIKLPACLRCKIGLTGTRDHSYFLLHINPDADISTTSAGETALPSNTPSTTSSDKVQQPTVALQQLICFKTRSGRINILEQIGTHYRELGILLLDDTTGAVTKAIIEQYNYDATKIIFEIFEKWIQGKGKLPVEWATLIEVLNDIGLSELANKMKAKETLSD